MVNKKYILAIDQGTSSTKSLIFDEKGIAVAKGSEPLRTSYFDNGFVEQDPQEIYSNVLASVKYCLQDFIAKGYTPCDIACVGLSNQRETFILWDEDGEPLYPAVVWQCKRSVEICRQLKEQGLSEKINQKTGLVIDPYFSGTKLIWLMQNNPEIAKSVKNGNAYFGTVDTWLLYKLSKGNYATDYTNASRTLFFNIQTLTWDEDLIADFGLNGLQLPQIKPSSSFFGETNLGGLLDQSVPVTAMIGDSHAAAFGAGCFDRGSAKATLGTGSSIMMNIGDKPLQSQNGMVTTINWSIEGRVDYALEGVIVTCGATIEWLKNELGLFNNSVETEAMALAVEENTGVYLIPAFSGLGSPHWQMDRRASISGLSFGTTKNHIVRAALESIPYQIKDVIAAMENDTGVNLKQLVTNGGLTSNNFVMQFLADILDRPVNRGANPDVSAMGAAYMAGLYVGIFKDIEQLRTLSENDRVYQPSHNKSKVENWYTGWQKLIKKN